MSWLAAPEPVKVAAKATPRSPPYKASSKKRQRDSSAVNDSGKVVSGSNPPFRSQSERSAAASEQGAEARSSGLPQAQRSLAANAEVSPTEASQEVGLPAPAASPVSANNAQPAASAAPATAAKPLKRPQPRQARSRSEKSALALMTLRTIEFADGRRVTRLIPYRGPERALAFAADRVTPQRQRLATPRLVGYHAAASIRVSRAMSISHVPAASGGVRTAAVTGGAASGPPSP